VGNQTALNGVMVHRIIPIQLFQLHRHHMECRLQKVNTHSTLLIPQPIHHKDIKNHHLHLRSLLNSYSWESNYVGCKGGVNVMDINPALLHKRRLWFPAVDKLTCLACDQLCVTR
jgi:hypothetical protein